MIILPLVLLHYSVKRHFGGFFRHIAAEEIEICRIQYLTLQLLMNEEQTRARSRV